MYMNKQPTSKLYGNPDFLYYNISIPHNDLIGPNGEPTPAVFSEHRTNAILYKADEYYMSVIRFSVPSNLLPLTRFPVQPAPNTDINLSLYSVTLEDVTSGDEYQTFLRYVPHNLNINPPLLPPATNIQFIQSAPYYWVYSVEHMLQMINTAFTTSFNALNAAHPVNFGTTGYAPFFTLDPVPNLFTLNAQQGYLNSTTPVNIYINAALNDLFSNSFNTITYGYGLPNGADFQYLVYDTIYNRRTIAVYGDIFSMIQDFNTLPMWVEPLTLVFTSGAVPVAPELVPYIDQTGFGANQTGILNNNTTVQITDFNLNTATGTEYRTFINYLPTAEYRRLSLISGDKMDKFTIQLFWKDNYENIYPVLLPDHYVVTIKLLFQKKDTVKKVDYHNY